MSTVYFLDFPFKGNMYTLARKSSNIFTPTLASFNYVIILLIPSLQHEKNLYILDLSSLKSIPVKRIKKDRQIYFLYYKQRAFHEQPNPISQGTINSDTRKEGCSRKVGLVALAGQNRSVTEDTGPTRGVCMDNEGAGGTARHPARCPPSG